MPGATAEADDRTMSPVHATTDSEFEAAITSVQLLRQRLESAPDAIVGIDRDGAIAFVLPGYSGLRTLADLKPDVGFAGFRSWC